MCMFSFIVPVYNVEKYLKECIDSLISQTYKNFEIILVDDGSKDNSGRICDEFAEHDSRIKVIHKENGGASSTRKVGANNATGEYIVCVDADDWAESTYLENFANAIDSHRPDIVLCEFYNDDGIGKTYNPMIFREGLYNRENIEKEIFPYLIENINGKYISNNIWAKAIKRELYVNYQSLVDDSIKFGEDIAIIKPCIYKSNTLYIIKKPLYNYRFNPSSITKSRKPRSWTEPKIRNIYIEKQIDMSAFDFKEQIYRLTVHSVFNVAESQFNRKEKYSVIAKNIKQNLKDEYYKEAIKNCKFEGRNGKLALFALKYKLILLIKIYNRIKK